MNPPRCDNGIKFGVNPFFQKVKNQQQSSPTTNPFGRWRERTNPFRQEDDAVPVQQQSSQEMTNARNYSRKNPFEQLRRRTNPFYHAYDKDASANRQSQNFDSFHERRPYRDSRGRNQALPIRSKCAIILIFIK